MPDPGDADNLPSGRERILRIRLAFVFRHLLILCRKNRTVPGAERRKTKGIRFKIMDDAMTIILVVVLFILLKPILGAILRGFGSSEHRRDR